MKPIIRVFFRFFIYCMIAYPILTCVIDLLLSHELDGKDVLISTLGFSTLFSMMMTALHYYQVREIKSGKLTYEDFSPHQKYTLNSKQSPEEIIEKLKNDQRLKTARYHKSMDKIKVEIPMSWLSWGTKMDIQYSQQGDDYAYNFHSYPKFKLSLTDNGESLDIISRVKKVV